MPHQRRSDQRVIAEKETLGEIARSYNVSCWTLVRLSLCPSCERAGFRPAATWRSLSRRRKSQSDRPTDSTFTILCGRRIWPGCSRWKLKRSSGATRVRAASTCWADRCSHTYERRSEKTARQAALPSAGGRLRLSYACVRTARAVSL